MAPIQRRGLTRLAAFVFTATAWFMLRTLTTRPSTRVQPCLALVRGQYGLALAARRFSVAVDNVKGDGVRRWADR